MICESSDLVYVVAFLTCNKDYIEEIREGKARVQKVSSLSKKYLSTEISTPQMGGTLSNLRKKIKRKKFSFVKLHSKNKDLRKQYEMNSIDEFKHTLRN